MLRALIVMAWALVALSDVAWLVHPTAAQTNPEAHGPFDTQAGVATVPGAGGFQATTFGAPAFSSAPCLPGTVMIDATWIYSHVAANTWHPTSNGAAF